MCLTTLLFPPLLVLPQVLRELYPVDGSAPYLRSMDPLDMEMRVVVHDLGKDEQVRAELCLMMVVTARLRTG